MVEFGFVAAKWPRRWAGLRCWVEFEEMRTMSIRHHAVARNSPQIRLIDESQE
jgi:hypothetical protein